MRLRSALLAALLAPLPLAAQSSSLAIGGPYAPGILLLPAGARTLAMGNTGVTSRDDDVLFFNPAQLTLARGMSASFERYSPSASGGALSSVTRFNSGGIAVGMRVVDYEAPAGAFPSDRGSLASSGPDEGVSLEAIVGMAQVFKGWRVGAAGKYVEDEIPAQRVRRPALDLGVSKDFFQSYNFGLAVQNIGKDMLAYCPSSATCSPQTGPNPANGTPVLANAHLPLRTTLGVSTARPVGEFDLAATAAVSMLRANWVSPSGGAELGYSWLDGYSIALRGGARRGLPGEGTITAGAGFTMDRLSIDYALETLSGSRIAHRVGLRVR